jgi:hypothetical protein
MQRDIAGGSPPNIRTRSTAASVWCIGVAGCVGALACGSTHQTDVDVVRAYAATDFPCPAASIEVDPGGDTDGVSYVATGCQATAVYSCGGDCESNCGPDDCGLAGLTEAWSTVFINGAPFFPAGSNLCSPGEGESPAFVGVDLRDASGKTLRLIQTQPGLELEVLVIVADGESPTFTACGALRFYDRYDGVRSGDATLDCSDASWTIKGTVTFYGC